MTIKVWDVFKTYVASDFNKRKTARELGIHRETVANKVKQFLVEHPEFVPHVEAKSRSIVEKMLDEEPSQSEEIVDDPLSDLGLDDPEKNRLKRMVSTLRGEVSKLQQEKLDAETVRTQIFGLVESPETIPDWVIDFADRGTGPSVPMTIWSDWHIGEKVNKSETNGTNAFDLEIAEQRIKMLVERMIDLCFHHMTDPQYPGIIINMLGDMVSGEIHPELEATNDDDLFPILLWTRDILVWALDRMLEHFPYVFVPCTPGNHGRAFDKRPRAKRYVYRNTDWLLYQMLDRHYHPMDAVTGERKPGYNDRIHFCIPASGEVLYSVYGHRYMATHGDMLGVKGGDGIIGALGPIMRGEIKMRNSSAQIGRDYDTLLIGHWHQTLWLPRCFVNNSLKGYDEYARLMLRAPHTDPSQSLWFHHPRNGITAHWEIKLDRQKTESVSDWISWKS